MTTRYVLSEYVGEALAQAAYDKLDDGSFAGKIAACPGVLAFGKTLRECQDELRSTLEDWILVGLKLGHRLPVLANIDLNKEPLREPGGLPVSGENSSARCGSSASKDPCQERATSSSSMRVTG